MKEGAVFVVARNPEADSKLPYLLRLPLGGGMVLKARDTWPTVSRVYCHTFEEPWPMEAEVVEEVPVISCRRRGAAVDLVLDRPRLARSQFVFTEVRGRPATFWQTQKTARAANPGGRIPRRRGLAEGVTIAVDTRERYPYRFATQGAQTIRMALRAGDYAVRTEDEALMAAVDRKSLENLGATLSDGTLAFQMQRLSELPLAAVVVEGRYSGLYKVEHVPGSWLADQLSRLEVRYPGPRGVRRFPPLRRGVDLSLPFLGARRHGGRHRLNHIFSVRETRNHSFRPLQGQGRRSSRDGETNIRSPPLRSIRITGLRGDSRCSATAGDG